MFKEINRPNKRTSQGALTDLLVDKKPENYKEGNVLILSGPKPAEAVSQYLGTILGTKYLLIEKDFDTYCTALCNISTGSLLKDTVLFHTDIFDKIHVLMGDEGDKVISGLDLDFCTTLNKEVRRETALALRSIILNNKLPCFWVRITSCPRGIGLDGTNGVIEAIKDYTLVGTKYTVKDEIVCRYKDSIPMYSYQGFFINTSFTEATTMEKEMKKTLKQLTVTDRTMVQILARNTSKQLSLEDIAKKFGLAPTTTAALKAHQTMRKRYK
jgi:hypothetical protein